MENQPNQENQKSLQVIESDSGIATESKVADLTWWLTPAELFAYNQFLLKYCKNGSNTFPIASGTKEGLFALFLNGKTIAEIRKLNPQFALGQIVNAAIEDNWYQTKEVYLETMVQRAKIRAIQATAEGLEFAADLVAALRKQHGDHIARFLQTGDINDLGAATSTTVIRQLKELTELLSKLTGADQNKRVTIQGTVEHSGEIRTATVIQPVSDKLSKWAQEKKAAELKKFPSP
jgi:hypothetical protein